MWEVLAHSADYLEEDSLDHGPVVGGLHEPVCDGG